MFTIFWVITASSINSVFSVNFHSTYCHLMRWPSNTTCVTGDLVLNETNVLKADGFRINVRASDNPGEPLAGALFTVQIEDLANGPDQQPSGRLNRWHGTGICNQLVLDHRLQATHFIREVAVEIFVPLIGELLAIEPELADQLADHPAANPVVAGEAYATDDGQLAGIDGRFPRRQVVVVLEVGIVGLADSGHTQRHQVAIGVGGVTLEVSVQAAFALGHRQAVVRLGEVVHTDVFVAGFQSTVDGVVQNGQLLLWARQGIRLDPGLRVEAIRQVRVAEHREAVRRHLDHRLQGFGKAFRSLVRQAVDQVQVDGAEADTAGFVQHCFGHLPGLDAVYRFLHFRVHILHAQADAVEAQLPQGRQGIFVHFTGVDFHTVVPVVAGLQVKHLTIAGHQVLHHIPGQEGGCATAPVQLLYGPVGTEQLRLDGGFFQHSLHVRHGLVALLGDHLVAGAVVAQVRTERQVGVERDWPAGGLAAACRFNHVFNGIVRGELHRRGVRRVAWAAQVIAADKRLVPNKSGQVVCCSSLRSHSKTLMSNRIGKPESADYA